MGAITLVAAITPFQMDRNTVRSMHERKGLPFWEVFVDCKLVSIHLSFYPIVVVYAI